jgi:hypothetical protein
MTSPIFFNVKEAREHLVQHGFVYTIRHRRQTGKTVARNGSFYKFEEIAPVKVQEVMLLHEEGREVQLADYVRCSGFRTVQEWIGKVTSWKHPMFLYLVYAHGKSVREP